MTFRSLITGGSRGLGRDMALQLARNGHDIIITYRSAQAEAASVISEITSLGRKAVALQLDVGAVNSFASFTQELRSVLRSEWGADHFDHLVNNAGNDVTGAFSTVTEAQFDSLFNVHFKGVFFLTQALLPMIVDGGRIICISSGLTRFSVPGYSAYAAMKGAVEILAKYLAKELGSRRIAVNVVAPGAVETDFTSQAFSTNPGLKEFIASQTALGRVGQPQDIGGIVAFLCSPAAGWINAQRIEASGGMFL